MLYGSNEMTRQLLDLMAGLESVESRLRDLQGWVLELISILTPARQNSWKCMPKRANFMDEFF